MAHYELRTKIGPDGVLSVSVPLGTEAANHDARVIVETTDRAARSPDEWRQFVETIAGSIDDPTFRRWEQGELEDRGVLFD